MIAPTATSSDPGSPPTIATIGISDSGSAVATAASTLPTAPCPSPTMLPNHSIAFVKSSAPASRIAKLAGSRIAEPMTVTLAPGPQPCADTGLHSSPGS